MSCPAEATLEPERNSSIHGTYYLSVTADTSERAQADLATLTKALQAAFPSAERNLSVSLNNSTVPAPNHLSRQISFGVRTAMILMMLGCQLLLVIGAYREGAGRRGVFAAITTPFTLLIFPGTGGKYHVNDPGATTDWKFAFLLLARTPVSVIVGLWLTRRSRRVGGHPRRA